LKLLFRTKKLRQLCENQIVAKNKLGHDRASKLRARLADLSASRHVGELVCGDPHPLIGDRKGQFALTLDGGSRLVFSPANEPVPYLNDGGIDWQAATIVRIEFIGDYHE